MNLIGYARVSTTDQDHALQTDALAAAGCARVFTENASGSLDTRPQLARCLDHLRPGDTLIVWRLDRLGRSVRHLTDTVTFDLRYSRQAFDHGLSGCRNEERCP